MAINGTFSIFRLTSTGNTETLISDKVEFNGDAVIPDARSKIQTVKPIMSIVGQENDTPDSNNPSHLDETGLALVGLEITGYFLTNESSRPLAPRVIRNWMKTDKKVTDFPNGRFGFRNNIDNEFDISPLATSGYILEHFECEYDYTNHKSKFFIKMRYQNRITDLNSA